MKLFGVKSWIKRLYLRYKFGKTNHIEQHVHFANDTLIEGGAFIGSNTIIWPGVKIGLNVRIGKNTRLSRIAIGENSIIESEVICTGCGDGVIIIGKESYIGHRVVLDWSDDIIVGNYVHIAGPSTGLWTHSSASMCLHSIPLSRISCKEHRPTAPITIENNVYIGGNCTIYPGVTIHHHSVIAPNSAVTKDVAAYNMVGGVPAKTIKRIRI
jgi:acetyltransferase-like isoleucine patch superfamily enzyme